MIPPEILTEQITIERLVATGLDEWGNEISAWQVVSTVAARVEDTARRVAVEGRFVVVKERRAFINAGDVQEGDRVIYGGDAFRVLAVLDRQMPGGGFGFKRIDLERAA